MKIKVIAALLLLVMGAANAKAEDLILPMGQTLRGEIEKETIFEKVDDELIVTVRITEYERSLIVLFMDVAPPIL